MSIGRARKLQMLETTLRLLLLLLGVCTSQTIAARSKNKMGKLKLNQLLTQGRNQSEKTCQLDASVFVKRVLDETFYPIYEKYDLKIPWKCPFERSRNMYRMIEENTLFSSADRPKCGFCGKSFYTENFFHQHMERKHNDSFLQSKDSVCLAEYCDLFRCHVHRVGSSGDQIEKCDLQDMRNLRVKCEKLMQRCLPSHMSEYVYDSVTDSICAPITCDKYHIPSGEATALQVLLYTIVTIVSAFLLLIGCCFAIDYFEHENYESMTRQARTRGMEMAQQDKEYALRQRIRFNNNRGDLRSRHARVAAPDDVRINVH